jgi:hypothetical protein
VVCLFGGSGCQGVSVRSSRHRSRCVPCRPAWRACLSRTSWTGAVCRRWHHELDHQQRCGAAVGGDDVGQDVPGLLVGPVGRWCRLRRRPRVPAPRFPVAPTRPPWGWAAEHQVIQRDQNGRTGPAPGRPVAYACRTRGVVGPRRWRLRHGPRSRWLHLRNGDWTCPMSALAVDHPVY